MQMLTHQGGSTRQQHTQCGMCASIARQAILVETCAWNSFQLQDMDALCSQISCCCLPVQRLGHLRAPCPRRVPRGAYLGNISRVVFVVFLTGACFVRTQGVGVSRSRLPTSLFEHLSMGQASHPPTKGTTLSVSSVLSCPLWPCAHRMCVIAKETGLSPLASTCSRTWAFLRCLHISAHRFLCLTPFTSEDHDRKNRR